MPGDDVVEAVEQSVGNGGDQATGGTSDVHRSQQRDPTCPIADERSVAEHEVPAREPIVCGEPLEQSRGFLVAHGQERELGAPVEDDDDPRRPAAEPSPGVVEEHRAS